MIFTSFTQANGSTTRKYGGTGLGLTISSKLVELMKGRIWVESPTNPNYPNQGGPGTTFHFLAHFGLSSQVPVTMVAEKEDQLNGEKILVVDDNVTNLQVLGNILTNWGAKPTLVESGPLALVELKKGIKQKRPYILALLDVNMPGMDGFTLAEKILKNNDLAKVTIMMLTSSHRKGDIERCKQLGISGYLTKPVKRKRLLHLIRERIGLLKKDEDTEVRQNKNLKKSTPSNQTSDSYFRILLAEDNSINQKLAIAMIKKKGWDVTPVTDGESVLKLLEKKEFDLILMDVQMPKMDGIQATCRIREKENNGDHHIPIIAMTAHAMQGDRQKCLNVGMDSYISKPMKAKELYSEVERIIKKGTTWRIHG